MPDSKVSALPVMLAADLAANDLIDVVDVSSGTSDQMTIAEFDARVHARDVYATGVATPTAAVDTVVNFGRTVAKRALPAFVGPSGLDSAIQPFLARNKVGYWNPPGGAQTFPGVFGYGTPTTTGFTTTNRSPAGTNMFTRMRRLGFVTIATAGTVGQFRVGAAMFTLGAGGTPPLGGFHKILRFGISDGAAVSGARMFMGMAASAGTAPTNVEPSTLTSVIGMGHGASDTTMRIYYGGSTAQTPIDLGANFPANTFNVDVYELALFAPPSTLNTVHYEVTRLNTGHVASGTLTAATAGVQLPGSGTMLTNMWGHRTNNATALAVGLDVMSDYIETDQ